MAVNYNTLKSLKGTSIGTIVPWCGQITSIPPGWNRCDGAELNVSDYPDLFDLIGYRYGGSGNVFKLPRIQDKAMVDYHTSHTNVISGGIPTIFRNAINNLNDVANAIELNPISNIDLYVQVETQNNYIGEMTAFALNNPSYFESVIVASRLLSDHHLTTHSHSSFVDVVGRPTDFVEACQQNRSANCFSVFGEPDCSDDCDVYQVWRNEENNADITRTQVYTYESINVMESLYTKASSNNGIGRIPSTGEFALDNSPYNYILPAWDPIETSGNTYPYPVSLATDIINWTENRSDPHRHNEMNFSIDIGNVQFSNLYTINNIGTGNVAPIDGVTRSIANFRANVSTASLQILHIIRVY
jgi:hypothetical protein